MSPTSWVGALLTALVAGALAWAGTGVVRRFAVSRAMLDHPNDRSSHVVPTPRGGGLAIALVMLGGIALLAATGVIPARPAVAVVGGGILVAAVGWLDDARGLSPLPRAVVHFAAAVWALAWLGGLPTLAVGGSTLALGPAGWLVGALFVVWCVNLYNFMDGIDGIAAGQAVVAGVAGAVLCAARGHWGVAYAALLVAAASGGFLVWNWAPARIFMGDVGSGLLGFVFAVLALAAERTGAAPALAWVLLLAPFVADATVTLARRVARGERWYAAHRSHAYQRAVQAGWPHARVSAAAMLLAALHAPLAAVATQHPRALLPILLVSAGVLGGTYIWIERVRPMARGA